MAYRLEHAESVRAGVARVVTEELDGAVDLLTAPGENRVEAVHAARKHLKKARSALRLVRRELPGKTFASANDRLRQAARRLSGVRDAQVAVTALDRLREAGEEAVPPAVWDEVRRVLDNRRQAAGDQLLGAGGFAADVARQLIQVRDELADLSLQRNGWKALRGGLTHEYARGAEAHAKSARKPTAENLHDWRRRVKDAWYHLRLLEPSWPGPLGDLADEAHRLSELLGDDHDLANLRGILRDEPSAFGAELDGLVALLDDRRAQLQAQARLLGDRLYAERPAAYAGRLRVYWRAWRSTDEVDLASNGQRAAPDGTVSEPALAAVPGAVERPATVAPAPPPIPEPLLAAPAVGSVEQLPAAPPAAAVRAPQLPRPDVVTAQPPPTAPATAPKPRRPATPPKPKPARAPRAKRDTVYVTTGGRRYHRTGCTLAGPNAKPLSRTAAEEAGLAPCRACRP